LPFYIYTSSDFHLFASSPLHPLTPAYNAPVLINLKRWLRRDGIALLVFAIAAALTIYPVLPALRWHVIGWPGDNVQYVYMSGWVAEALRTGQSPLLDPHLNFPGQLWLPATDAPFLSMVLAAPLAWAFTPTLAYNAILFASSFFSGYFTYLWLRRIASDASSLPGIVAGLAFMLSPYRIVHSYGHLQLISTQFIPMFFWALDNAVFLNLSTKDHEEPQQGKTSWPFVTLRGLRNLWPHIALAGATALVGAMSQYYLVICAVAGAAYVLLARRPWQVYLQRGWRWLIAIAVGAVLSAWPYLLTSREAIYSPYTLEETRIWSANPLDFLMPSRLHPLWGAAMEQFYPRTTWIEHTLYVGVIALLLTLVAVLNRKRDQARAHIGIWLGVCLVAFVLALGTDLHVGLISHALQEANPIWLPTYYLAHLPGVSLMRTWSRFGVVVIFFVSALAGLGIRHLRGRMLPLLCALLLVIDLFPGRLVHFTLQPRPIDTWLAQQPGDFAVAILPAGYSNYEDMYGSLLHHKAMPAFNHPTHLTREFRNFAEATRDFPQADALAQLRAMNVRYILINQAAYDGKQLPTWADVATQLQDQPTLQKVTEVDGFAVFAWR